MISSAHRFLGRGSIRFVYRRGQTVRDPLVALRYVRNGRQPTYRAAVVVSRKISKSAVVRNHIRRRIYEIVRSASDQITVPYDMIFIVHSEDVAKLSYDTVRAVILGQLKKAGILSGAAPSGEKHATINSKEENKA